MDYACISGEKKFVIELFISNKSNDLRVKWKSGNCFLQSRNPLKFVIKSGIQSFICHLKAYRKKVPSSDVSGAK